MTGCSAKDIVLRPVSSKAAADLVRRVHYSGKAAVNAQLNIGVYLDGRMEGAMQLGPPMDKRKLLGLVGGTPWNGMLELNRMAFTEALPKNSESRALAVALRLIRRHAPHVKWIVSFADGTQCGDGAIYRAAGFLLTAINTSRNLARLPDGSVVHKLTLESSPTAPRPEVGGRSYFDVTGGRLAFGKYLRAVGGQRLPGYQLRYVAFVDPSWRSRLTVAPLAYSAITEAGARMYRGQRR